MNENKLAEFLDWRGVRDACEGCQGTGYKTYGSTATFWGGIGGAAMTTSVCDKCWGSGDQFRPWKSWRLIKQEMQDRAPLYDRLKVSVWKVVRAHEQEPEGVNRAWTELKKILNKES